ncbi:MULTISPECIES: AMP-binding protein [unclassified Rhodococcus (in: high G+C Gram-positive bacteria)]|uniref:AMP-binding protein n=1 Tax=unclassified Rhodococcus (in: high G+C Gram-positive bacteria) TaxID=192944 RepID=UPI001639DB13|nr:MULTISPECIES: AMP-binding protein [unclassified Rhodococcus (in: high G+C Gram-positive bacteria)]MBC2642586.1 AMP-binding protein [Rhodococcus sp. 3A]MBC2892672.1 AMP-binding protein [Rhodococcus sp. 4CII]
MTELLAERIAARATENGDTVAVVSARETVDYGRFWTRVARTAAGLDGMDRLAVLPTSDVGSLVAVAAAMHAGVSVVLLHRHLLPGQLTRVLELAKPGAVVAAPNQHTRLRRLGFDGTIETAGSLESDGIARRAHPGAELLVGITSGTTGEPNLFVRNQRSWATTLDRSDTTFDIGSGDRVSVPGVLDHTHFLYGALHALTRGATVDLRPVTQSLLDAPTHLYSVPTIAWDVVRSGIGTVGSIREVLSSAARWPRTGREALQDVLPNASLVHFYGASELSFVSFDRGLGADDEHSVGELFDGVDVEIRDGLVYVRSDMLFDGYLTEDGVVDGPSDGWMTVGDRGRVVGTGLHLFGRATDTVIRAGLNVEPAAVEAALIALPGVVEAACIGVPDSRMGEAPAAAIVVDGAEPRSSDIWRHLRATLPSPSMPVQVLVVDSLPRTPRGKLDRPALAATLAASRDRNPA